MTTEPHRPFDVMSSGAVRAALVDPNDRLRAGAAFARGVVEELERELAVLRSSLEASEAARAKAEGERQDRRKACIATEARLAATTGEVARLRGELAEWQARFVDVADK